MTIKPVDHMNQILTPVKSSAAARETNGPDFASFLSGPKAAPAPKAPAGSAEALLLENQALSGLVRPGPETASLETRQQLERTLDRMDRYAVALGDEGRTLKDLAPLADDLGQEADRLSRLSHKLTENDPLKGLSNEAAVLATVEAMKFKRGDYV